MDKLTETKANRFRFLHDLWEATGGNRHSFVSMWDVGEELGFVRQHTDLIVQYLVDEGLVEYVAMGGRISITHHGIREVEAALSEPERPTHYFPPVNIVNVQNMMNSQIQQATSHSVQTASFGAGDLDGLKALVSTLESRLNELQVDDDTTEEMKAEITTLKAQLGSKRPKSSILFEALKSVRAILEGATGSMMAAEALPLVIQFVAKLGHGS